MFFLFRVIRVVDERERERERETYEEESKKGYRDVESCVGEVSLVDSNGIVECRLGRWLTVVRVHPTIVARSLFEESKN